MYFYLNWNTANKNNIMTNKLLLILILNLIGVNSTIAQSKLTKRMTAEQEVLETVKAWNDAFEANDVETYFSYIHDSLTLCIPSSPYRIDGKKHDRQEFEWSLKRERTRVSLFQELQSNVQILGNTAIVTYHNRGAYGPDGQEQIAYLKETNILVKENGKWKIIHIHVSK